MRFAFILAERACWPVVVMCAVLKVSASGFYAWIRSTPSVRDQKDERLKVLIGESFAKSRKTYGSPRVHADLVGERVGRNRVIRIMQSEQLVARVRRRYRSTTMSEHDQPIHMRPYTGQQVIRKGWRMQDRRVLPGTSDYYVHDEDGRPVLRVAVPSHDSLTTWLPPIGKRLRDALGDEATIVLAFDRAGAFAKALAGLRDTGFDFVTYERKPYPDLPASTFTSTTIAGDEVGLHEDRLRNLGAGRGRVWRIAVRTADERRLALPGDPRRLPLRFSTQLQ